MCGLMDKPLLSPCKGCAKHNTAMKASVDRHSDDGMASEDCSRSAKSADTAVQSYQRVGCEHFDQLSINAAVARSSFVR